MASTRNGREHVMVIMTIVNISEGIVSVKYSQSVNGLESGLGDSGQPIWALKWKKRGTEAYHMYE